MKHWEDYILRQMSYQRSDDLERARAVFRGMTADQMAEQHGQSGYTRQQLLDGYVAERILHDEAVAYLLALFAKEHASVPALAQPNSASPTARATKSKVVNDL